MSLSKVKREKDIRQAILQHPTMLAAANSIGMSFGTFKYRANKIGIYNPNQGGRGVQSGLSPANKIPLQQIIDGQHPQYNTNELKIRLIKEGILDESCELCGLENSWNNLPLVLQLDHKNGISNDHALDNVRLLCPNCHSQTPNFSGKNANKTSRIKVKITNNGRLCT